MDAAGKDEMDDSEECGEEDDCGGGQYPCCNCKAVPKASTVSWLWASPAQIVTDLLILS